MNYFTVIIIFIYFSLLFISYIYNDDISNNYISNDDISNDDISNDDIYNDDITNNDSSENFSNNNFIDLFFIQEFTKENSLYRPVPSTNLEKVKLNVINLLSKISNFKVQKQFFTRKIHNKEYLFYNIIANSKDFDKTKPYIILSAHIDGPVKQINTPGAIDAITSIGIIIELVRKLTKNIKNYNLQIVFFDGEEAIDGTWGDENSLSGSKYFVKQLNNFKPSQVFVFDLIGADIDKNKLYAYSNNPKSFELMSKLAWTNNRLYPENKRIFVDPHETISYIIIKDDSKPFYEANIPVIDLIPPTFPSTHHTTNDNYKNVNWDYVNIFANVIYDYLLNNPVKY